MKPLSYYPVRGGTEGREGKFTGKYSTKQELNYSPVGNDGHDIFCKTLAIQGHICNRSEVHYDLFCHQDNSASCQIDWIGNDFKYQSQPLALSLSLPHTHTKTSTHTKLLPVSDRDDDSSVPCTVFFSFFFSSLEAKWGQKNSIFFIF